MGAAALLLAALSGKVGLGARAQSTPPSLASVQAQLEAVQAQLPPSCTGASFLQRSAAGWDCVSPVLAGGSDGGWCRASPDGSARVVCDSPPLAPPDCVPPGGRLLAYNASGLGWQCLCTVGWTGASCTTEEAGAQPGTCVVPACDSGLYTFANGTFACHALPLQPVCGTYPTSQYNSFGLPPPLGPRDVFCNCTGWSWQRSAEANPSSYFGMIGFLPQATTAPDANLYPGGTATMVTGLAVNGCPGASTPDCEVYNYTSAGGTCTRNPSYVPTPWSATCHESLADCQAQCPQYTSAAPYASSTYGACGFGGIASDGYGNFSTAVCSDTPETPYYCPGNEFSTLSLPGYEAPVISGYMGYDLAYVVVASPYECLTICNSLPNCVGFVLVVYDRNLECDPKYNMDTPSWNTCPTTSGCFGFKRSSV